MIVLCWLRGQVYGAFDCLFGFVFGVLDVRIYVLVISAFVSKELYKSRRDYTMLL